MIEETIFQEGINRIAVAVRQVADAATQGVYLDVFSPRMESEEWVRFARWAAAMTPWVGEPRYRAFPSVPELLEALRTFRGDRPLLAEATEAYERVLASGVYTPQGGTTWTHRGVRERCGEAAAEAWLAAGGNAAFASTWEESKRRERFVTAYAEAVRENPDSKLLPAASEPKALPAPASPSREEARQIVERVREIVGEQPAAQPAGRRVTLTDERAAELERQKRTILFAHDVLMGDMPMPAFAVVASSSGVAA